MTFQESYNKIVTAYYRNELNPWDPCACFVGNLLNGNNGWGNCRHSKNFFYPNSGATLRGERQEEVIRLESDGFYTSDDITRLEGEFMWSNPLANEDDLFRAMTSTLELLRKIHEEKGEVIKDYTFTKRELQTL